MKVTFCTDFDHDQLGLECDLDNYTSSSFSRWRCVNYVFCHRDTNCLDIKTHAIVTYKERFFFNLALESRLRTHHSCKSVRFKQLIRDPYPHSNKFWSSISFQNFVRLSQI
jgi:hypothetical protein